MGGHDDVRCFLSQVIPPKTFDFNTNVTSSESNKQNKTKIKYLLTTL